MHQYVLLVNIGPRTTITFGPFRSVTEAMAYAEVHYPDFVAWALVLQPPTKLN